MNSSALAVPKQATQASTSKHPRHLKEEEEEEEEEKVMRGVLRKRCVKWWKPLTNLL